MKQYMILTAFIFAFLSLKAQGGIQGCIINIEEGKAYLDITASKVKVGDVLSVHEEAGYMIHPVTKKKIKKEGGILADLEILEIFKEYSVASIYPQEAIGKLKVGMYAEMPELPQGYANDSSGCPEQVQEADDENMQWIPSDADGVVRRYLQVTGLEKQVTDNSIPPFMVKKQLTYVTTKGKSETCYIYSALDLTSRKVYVKYDSPGLSYCRAINGNNHWFHLKHSKTASVAFLEDTWDILSDVFDVRIFDELKWDRMLGGKKMIQGKMCTGVVFTSKEKSNVTSTIYFDDNTGLKVYLEVCDGRDFKQEECLAYREVGGFLLCSKTKATYQTGKIKEETTVLQDICMDCPLDDFLFTKEGVKKAFK